VKKLTAQLQSDNPSWEVNCKAVKEVLSALTPGAPTESLPMPLPSAPADSHDDPCWGCGKFPVTGQSFQACSKCVECRFASKARFCSHTCLAENWPRHKKWHKLQALQQKERAANIETDEESQASSVSVSEDLLDLLDMSADPNGKGIAQRMSEVMKVGELEAEMARCKPGDRHGQKLVQNLKDALTVDAKKRAQRGDTKLGRLMVEAQHLHTQGAYDKAAKKLLKGIDEFKDHPDLHHVLGALAGVYRDSGDVTRAATTYLKIAELTEGSLTSIDCQPKKKTGNAKDMLNAWMGGDITTDAEGRERAAQICWAKAVACAWQALCTPPCEHMTKPDYLEDGFRTTSALVLRVHSSRTKNEIGYKSDLYDAICMRAAALAGSPEPEDQHERRNLIERGRRLAKTPQQRAVLSALETDVVTFTQGGYDAVPGIPDTMRKSLQLLKDSMPASGASRPASEAASVE